MNGNFWLVLLTAVLPGLLTGQVPDRLPLPGGGTYSPRELTRLRSAEAVARTLLGAYDLREVRRTTAADGRTYVRFQQQRDGAPVLGAEVTVQLDGAMPQGITGSLASPTLFAPAAAPASPRSDGELATAARAALLPDHPFAHQWNVTAHGAAWTTRNPWADLPGRYYLCRVFEVREPGGAGAEMVYLDRVSAKPVLRHPLHCDLQRRLYHLNTSFGNVVWNEGDLFAGQLNAEDTEMLTATQEIYSLYYRTFGRRSYDGAGGLMRSVTQAAISGCPNARAFNGIVLSCAGVVADDVVSHEWTHNYTNSMNGLLYLHESGAVQEAYADIFGEAVDLLNERGTDDLDQQHRDGCFAGNYRWNIAEDAVAIDTILRDLWSPECKTDPATITSDNFVCPTLAGTDIHSNSLVVSRTFALLTDGDTTAVDTVRGIGLTKALHVFYHANAHYVTRVTDFEALARWLRRSARDLQGVNLRALTLVNTVAPLSNQFITDADLESLERAIAATGLAAPAPCSTPPTLVGNAPSGCGEEPVDNRAVVFYEDWEGDTSGWLFTESPVHPATWDAKPWRTSTDLPDGRPGRAVFAPNARVGDCQTDRDNGTADLTSPEIRLPAGETGFLLRFDHYYSIEEGTDGGQLFVRRNDGDFVPVPDAAFLHNGYDAVLDPAVLNDNPLAGTPAFTGADTLSTTGSWGTSLVDLDAVGVLPDDRIRLRWTLGHDGCDGWLGWFVDAVTVGYCGEAILPVTYTQLAAAAAKDHITVSWVTEAEENNRGFSVERRAGPSADFSPLGFVAAGSDYRFEDRRVTGGTTYSYRLRQVDHDGTERLSDVVSATLTERRTLAVYPNPNRGAFTVRTAAERVDIYAAAGRFVRAVPVRGDRVSVAGLGRGVYVLRAGEEVRRVVVR